MSARIRNPSSRLIDAQQSAVAVPPPPARKSGRNKKTAASAPAPKGKGKAKGKAKVVKQAKVEMEVDPVEEEEDVEEAPNEPDYTLYCICLGFDTGEQPMIQCEHCSNWFHFNCINLDEEAASKIEAYCCDLCEQMGVGETRRTVDGPPSRVPAETFYVDTPKSSPKSKSKVATTKGKATKPVQPTDDDVASPSSSSAPAESDDEVNMEDAEDEEDEDVSGSEDTDPDIEADLVRKRPKRNDGGRSQRAKNRKISKDEEEEVADEEDGEYVGDEESVLREGNTGKKGAKGRTSLGSTKRLASSIIESPPPQKKRPTPRKDSSTPIPAATGESGITPVTEKTRAAVIKQLTGIFFSIFTASSTSDEAKSRSSSFAEEVEEALFQGYSEADAKGVRGPKQKYLAKFRSLHYNLKSNADFRSRISSDELTPLQIVNMTNEDLLTPELRAMAESVRAASLKHSVKEVLAAPTAKRTHKGEEEIDNFAADVAAEERRAADTDRKEMDQRARQVRQRERSESISMQANSPAGSPTVEGSPFAGRGGSPFAMGSPTAEISAPAGTYSPPVSNSPVPNSPIPASDTSFQKRDDSSEKKFDDAEEQEEDEGEMRPPPTKHRASFDLKSVWGQVKPSPSMESIERMEDTPQDDEDGELEFFGKRSAGEDDFDFEEDLLRDESIPRKEKPKSIKKSTTPPGSPPSAKFSLASTSAPTLPKKVMSELPPVWAGNLIVPDEGGYPAFAVQVGGRSIGSSPATWTQLLPAGLTMDGRVPTKVASKYLVECSFASSRELIVTALLPDLTGPSDKFPQKPTAESCKVKFQHIVDFYVNKDRIGVIAPPEHLKKVVKDIYIIPLKKGSPLPEYVELLDDHCIAENGRDSDLLLGVTVIQAGAIATFVEPRPSISAGSTPAPAKDSPVPAAIVPPATSRLHPRDGDSPWNAPTQQPSTSRAPPASLPPRSFAPPPQAQPISAALAPPAIPQFDPSSLSSLLAHPALLQSVVSAATSGSGSPIPAPSGPPGYNPGPPAYSNYGPGVGMGDSRMGGGGMGVPGRGPMPPGGPPPRRMDREDSPPRKIGFVHPSRMGLVQEPMGGGPSPSSGSPQGMYGGGEPRRGEWDRSNDNSGWGGRGGRGGGGHRGGDRGGWGGRDDGRGNNGRGRGGDFSPQPGTGWGGRGGRGRGGF